MNKERTFFQDFLFANMPVDEQDYPIVEIKYLAKEADLSPYALVSFDKMLRMNKRTEWDCLFKQIEGKAVCIKDDISIDNAEMEKFKRFFLGMYCLNLQKHSTCVCVSK